MLGICSIVVGLAVLSGDRNIPIKLVFHISLISGDWEIYELQVELDLQPK